jgi:hypothetical protein
MPHNAPRPSAALNVQGCPGGSETLAGTSDFQNSNHKSTLQQKSEAGPSIRIGQVRVRGPGADRFVGAIADKLLLALSIVGPRAFQYPKTSAAFHEAGHCVVGALQGSIPSKATIWPIVELGHQQWIGRTYGLPNWRVDKNTSADADLEHARSQLAGVVSEMLFDPDYRSGSSLNEVVTAQGIVRTAAAKLVRDPEQLWLETLLVTGRQLEANELAVRQIANVLMRLGSIMARLLQAASKVDVQP